MHFESLGCSVQKISLPHLKYSYQVWSSMMSTSGDTSFCLLLGGSAKPVNPVVELLFWLAGRARHTLPAILNGIIERRSEAVPPEANARWRAVCDALRRDLEDLLGDDGVFLYPPHPLPAPYHHQPLVVLFNFAYTAVFNVLGTPATAVPMGLATAERVPVGVQVVARRYCDRLNFAVAVELERAFGGWVPPFATV